MTFAFQCGLVINPNTGEVKIPKGLKLDEASLGFWTGLESAYPYAFPRQAMRLEAVEAADAFTALLADRENYLKLVKKLVDTRPPEEQERFRPKLEWEDRETERYKAILAKLEKRAKGETP